MSDREPSQTALGVAALRAAHLLLDGEPRVLKDDIALRLFGPGMAQHIRTDPRYQAEGARRLRAHVVVRSRYAEDRMAEAARRGVTQAVSLGAGFDTFPYRQPDWARGLHILEVDQPASQRAKKERLAAGGIDIPQNVEFVAVDFETTSLADGLAASSFDAGRPAFFWWLGVMVYLTEGASDAVFRTVAGLQRGSEIVFTFSPPHARTDPGIGRAPRLADLAEQAGEPWINHIEPGALAEKLRGFGFGEVTFLTPEDIKARYLGSRSDGLRISGRTTIASAIV